ncbi:MAG: hypothetical protein J2P50_01230 [Hyphomicrobiaceae bacterium]|nr:hypothetical protein [Hyphomicrobiaceae bacterium]
MIIFAQAADGGTSVLPALFIAIGLVALAAWATHWVWFFRSFGLFRAFTSFGKDNVVQDIMRKNWLRYFLGVMGLMIPIVGVIHGFALWAGVGARVGN